MRSRKRVHPSPERVAFPLVNNFDLIRLVAAVQVVYFHIKFHIHPNVGFLRVPLDRVLGPLTGVPIFFMISGFLISASFERHRVLSGYIRRRVARIYPALLLCLGVTIAILAVWGYVGPIWRSPKFVGWIVAQGTIGQSAHLAAFRGFGTGIPNGSLWTISVEVAFYAGLPLLYFFVVDRFSRVTTNILLCICAFGSFCVATTMLMLDRNSQATTTKLLAQTPVPYLFLFLAGILVQRNYAAVSRWIAGRVVWWAVGYYLVVALIPSQTCTVALGWCASQSSAPGAGLYFLSVLVLAGLVFSFAFSGRQLSTRVLRGYDASYGTYLFHMLLVNVAVASGAVGSVWAALAILTGSILIGAASWKLVERPSLRRWRGDRLGVVTTGVSNNSASEMQDGHAPASPSAPRDRSQPLGGNGSER